MTAPARPCRIRLFVSTMGGGVGQHTFLLHRALRERGHEVAIVALRSRHYNPPVRGGEQVALEEISVPEQDGPGELLAWDRLLRPLAGDVAVLAKGGIHAGSLALELALRRRFGRVVTIEHNLAFEPPPRTSARYVGGLVPGLGLWWYRQVLALWSRSILPHRIVCVSQAVADRLASSYHFSGRKLAVVPNGVDPARFRRDDAARARVRAAWGVPPDALVFGAVGRLHWQKGYDIGIRAFARMRAAEPLVDPYLVLVGDGPEREALAAQIAKAGLEDRVRLPGATREPCEALNGLDVFIMPSRWEGLGFALLEAMACERPVVAFAVGGPPEVLGDPGLGWLVPPEDEAAFAAALADAARRPEAERRGMGARGRDHVARHYDGDRLLGRLCEVIAGS